MRSTFGDCHGMIVVDWKEDVRYIREVRESVLPRQYCAILFPSNVAYLYCPRIGCLHEHERHRWSEQDNVGMFEVGKVFMFQVPVISKSDLLSTSFGPISHTLPKMQ